MTSTTPKTRWQEITDIWQKEQWLYGFVGALAGFIFGVAASGSFGRIVMWFANGFWNEALSIAITVIVLDRLNRIRANEERKLALFRQVKSRSNDLAIDALEQIQHQGWWEEALDVYRDKNGRIELFGVKWEGGVNLQFANLKAARLTNANLQNADLWEVNLESAELGEANLAQTLMWGANLQGADLSNANLQNAYLGYAVLQDANLRIANLQFAQLNEAELQNANLGASDLRHATLWGANLQNAYLGLANLQRSNLGSADLQNADLSVANLQEAFLDSANLQQANMVLTNLRNVYHIESVKFDVRTVLPDAEQVGEDKEGNPVFDKYWTPGTDMTRYTDPNHPDFWEPEWVIKQRDETAAKG